MMPINQSFSVRYGSPEISKFQYELGQKSWPEFMQHDAVVNKCWDHLYREFLQFQIGLFDGSQAIAVANTLPLNWSGKDDDLPDTGLDWAIQKACDDHNEGITSNMLVAVQILIDPTYRGKEISYILIDAMKKLAKSSGIYKMALPVRPTRKHEFPDMEMQDYVNLKNESGRSYDPWIRTHQNSGGQIGRICYQSMKISGSVPEWEKWTGLKFHKSGLHVVKGALSPIRIDMEANTGVYLEPNIWVIYKLN
jgi:GNAT superfamily N-acetyltransferase